MVPDYSMARWSSEKNSNLETGLANINSKQEKKKGIWDSPIVVAVIAIVIFGMAGILIMQSVNFSTGNMIPKQGLAGLQQAQTSEEIAIASPEKESIPGENVVLPEENVDLPDEGSETENSQDAAEEEWGSLPKIEIVKGSFEDLSSKDLDYKYEIEFSYVLLGKSGIKHKVDSIDCVIYSGEKELGVVRIEESFEFDSKHEATKPIRGQGELEFQNLKIRLRANVKGESVETGIFNLSEK